MNEIVVANRLISAYHELDFLIDILKNRYLSNQLFKYDLEISDDFNWDNFLGIATFYKVLPLAYQCLKDINSTLVPNRVVAYLRAQSCIIALKNSFHTHELFRVIDLFSQNQIPVIPFKGPCVAQQAYGDVNFRQFCDLDILVRKQDFNKAITLLTDLGYLSPYLRQSWKRSFLMRIASSFHYSMMAHELPLGRKEDEKRLYIDLHKQISKYCNLPFDELSQDLNPLTVQGQLIWTLSVEKSLILLCIHGSQDGWNKLQNIFDISCLIYKNPGLDWELMVKQSKKAYCLRRFLLGLALAERYFDARLPCEIKNAVYQDTALPTLVNLIINRLNGYPRMSRSWKSKYQDLKLKIVLLDRFVDRVLFFGDFVWLFLFSRLHRTTTPDYSIAKVA